MKTSRCASARRAWLMAAVFTAATSTLGGVTQLRQGDKPPPLSLPAVEGAPFSLDAALGRPVILLFGEVYHEKSLEAARVIQALLEDPRFGGTPPRAVMIVAQQAEATSLRDTAKQRGLTMPVLHDRERKVCAAYQVSVLPSVVIVDGAGRVVHAMASMSPRFQDVLTGAALFAAGKSDARDFESALRPASRPAESETARRAARLTDLARQLLGTGRTELAQDKFREALGVEPDYLPALLGLGQMSLQARQLAEAEKYFQAVLARDAKSTKATLGLAQIEALRGGAELPRAEERVRALLATRPTEPQAHYLLGYICEQSGRTKDALASYRRAAEILLERGDRE